MRNVTLFDINYTFIMLLKIAPRLFSISSMKRLSCCFSDKLFHQSNAHNHVNFIQKSCFHLSPICNESKEPDQEIYTIKNPFRYISQALNVLAKMREIDNEFAEYDFLEGTKQAIIHVSDRLAEGKFDDMKQLLTSNGMDSLKRIFNENVPKTSILRLQPIDIIVVVPTSVSVEVDNSNRKWVYVLVDCCCEGTRIVSSSFCREYTEGSNSSWCIDAMEYKK